MGIQITLCWSEGVAQIPWQKKDGPFTDVIAFLDELARHVPSRKAWDKLVFLSPLSEDNVPCKSHHLGHILGCIVDLNNSLPAFQFQVTKPDGEFVGVMRGLLFEGHLLVYDPMCTIAEWVPVHRMASDLSPAEDLSA